MIIPPSGGSGDSEQENMPTDQRFWGELVKLGEKHATWHLGMKKSNLLGAT